MKKYKEKQETKKSYTEIKMYNYLDIGVSKEQKQSHFELIKKQMKTAKSIEDAPALETLFHFWDLKRKLEQYIKEKDGTNRIYYRFIK